MVIFKSFYMKKKECMETEHCFLNEFISKLMKIVLNYEKMTKNDTCKKMQYPMQ